MKSRILSLLPPDRLTLGVLAIVDEDAGEQILAGPWPCYGKADSGRAAQRRNSVRDPRLPWGDHPSGRYRVTGWLAAEPQQARAYGLGRVILVGVEGDALLREQASGRETHDGALLRIHDGASAPDGRLRATFGCLRTTREANTILRSWVTGSNKPEFYECRNTAR